MATDIAEKDNVDAPVPDEATSSEPEPQTGFSLSSKKLKLVLLLFLVMGVQVAVGYMLLPEPAASQSNDPDNVDQAVDGTDEGSIDTMEVKLGTYNSTNGQTGGSSVIHVSFELTGIVARQNSQAVKKAFSETHKSRIRAAVDKVIRSSSIEELNDPDFSVMKRKIRAEINKVLPKSFIIEIVISDIRLMPQ